MSPSVAKLLAELLIRGVAVVPQGGLLRLAPRSALTPELITQVAKHKRELLDLFGPEQRTRTETPRRSETSAMSDAEWRVWVALSNGQTLRERELIAATELNPMALYEVLDRMSGRGHIRTDASGYWAPIS